MSSEQSTQPQLPPTNAIDTPSLGSSYENWFEYTVKAQPHHTDYAGVVWHGSYLTWMEDARVECLRSIGMELADLVALGCDLPVVELSIKYHRSLRLGASAVVKTRLEVSGVRMIWNYAIVSPDEQELYLTAQVTLVPLDKERGKIMRQLPSSFKEALARIYTIYK
jgi:acyl-CoA thioester hydrolase